MVFPVVVYGCELHYKESWVLKNWCFWTVVLEKTLEGPLDWKEIQLVHPKGYQSWVFIGRTDVEAATPILWPPHAKSWLIGKDPNTGKDWGQEEKGMTENEMVGWNHWLDGHGCGWTPGGEAWRAAVHGVANSRTWLSDWTESLKNNENITYQILWDAAAVAVAAAKSLQSCPTLCDPKDSSPPGSSVHRILQARMLEWVAISFSEMMLKQCLKEKHTGFKCSY